MDSRKYTYSFSIRKPPQTWMEINRIWGKCWCGRPRGSFEYKRRSHCSARHAKIWRDHIRRNWHAVRREILERDSNTCRICGRNNSRSGNRNYVILDIDHIVPKSLGGDEWTQGNLQTLCRTCHESKTMLDNRLFLSRRRSYGSRSITEWIR